MEEKSNDVANITQQLDEKKDNLIKESRGKPPEKQIELLTNALLISLYLDIPPQRSEWRFLQLKKPDDPNNANYVRGDNFVINNFKVNS